MGRKIICAVWLLLAPFPALAAAAAEIGPAAQGGYERAIADYTQALEANPREDRKSTRLNSSHIQKSRMPSSA